MTSNIGASKITEIKSKLGFSQESEEDSSYEEIKSSVLKELKNYLRPEFINRIDEIIVFHKLSKDDIKNISKIMIKSLKLRVEEKNITLNIDDSVYDYLAQKGYDASYGARPLRRTIQTDIEDLLSEEMLKGNIKEKSIVSLKAEDGKIIAG